MYSLTKTTGFYTSQVVYRRMFLKHQQYQPKMASLETRFRPYVGDVQALPRWSYNALSSWERLGHSKIPGGPKDQLSRVNYLHFMVV